MIYAVDEIARIVRPIAQRYGLRAVYLFGSYARGAATEDSDIDLMIDTTGTNIESFRKTVWKEKVDIYVAA